MPMATDRVVRPDKPKAKSTSLSYNPGLMGEWLTALDEYGRKNPKDIGIVKALEAQAHMGLRTGEIMNAPASAILFLLQSANASGTNSFLTRIHRASRWMKT